MAWITADYFGHNLYQRSWLISLSEILINTDHFVNFQLSHRTEGSGSPSDLRYQKSSARLPVAMISRYNLIPLLCGCGYA